MSPAATPRVLVAEDDPAILSLIRSFERISDGDRRNRREPRDQVADDRRRRTILRSPDPRRGAGERV